MSHAIECSNIILSLKDIFPSELIQVIVRLYWYLHSEPVLLLSDSKWDVNHNLMSEFSLTGYNVLTEILEINPNLRFYHMETGSDVIYRLVESNFECTSTLLSVIGDSAKNGVICGIYLIPGSLWNYITLCCDSRMENINGIKTCCEILNYRASWYHCTDHRGPDKVLEWFKNSINHPDFLAAQNILP